MNNPATLISTTREPSLFAPLDYLPRIDYATGIVLAGALVIGAVWAARRMTRGILTTTDVDDTRRAIAATEATTQAIVRPAGKLSADAKRAAEEDAVVRRHSAQASAETARVITNLRAVSRSVSALSLLPLPDVREDEPTQPAPFRP